jgi:hypothetical protein
VMSSSWWYWLMMVIIITIISIIIMIILPTIPLTKHLQCNFNSILNISLPEADSTMIPTLDDALINRSRPKLTSHTSSWW